MSNDDSTESARDFARRLVHWIYEGTFLQGNEPSLELVQLITARDKAVARRAWEEGWEAGARSKSRMVEANDADDVTNPYATPEESDDD